MFVPIAAVSLSAERRFEFRTTPANEGKSTVEVDGVLRRLVADAFAGEFDQIARARCRHASVQGRVSAYVLTVGEIVNTNSSSRGYRRAGGQGLLDVLR